MSVPKGFIELNVYSEPHYAVLINVNHIVGVGQDIKLPTLANIQTSNDKNYGPFVESYDEILQKITDAITPMLPSQRASLARRERVG